MKTPQRDLPLGIIFTLAMSTLLYIAVSIILCGMVPWDEIDTTAPLSSAFLALHQNWVGTVVAFGKKSIMFYTSEDNIQPVYIIYCCCGYLIYVFLSIFIYNVSYLFCIFVYICSIS